MLDIASFLFVVLNLWFFFAILVIAYWLNKLHTSFINLLKDYSLDTPRAEQHFDNLYKEISNLKEKLAALEVKINNSSYLSYKSSFKE
jgi:cell shape-determining protein MreC